MKFKVNVSLTAVLPKVIAWAEEQSAQVMHQGVALNETLKQLAMRAGVRYPHLIRIVEVAQMPQPEDPELQTAAAALGMMGKSVIGLTLGYSIIIRRGHRSERLLSHEFRHIQQFEKAGSIRAFLPVYISQIRTFGYHNAPFEVDARAFETFAGHRELAPSLPRRPHLRWVGSVAR